MAFYPPRKPKFRLGRPVITSNCLARVREFFKHTSNPDRLTQTLITGWLREHESGHWGNVSEIDRKANERALLTGDRLMSVYQIDDNCTLWIITEADRSVTTVLLPEDY